MATEVTRAILELALDFNAWARSRPAHETRVVGDALNEEVLEIAADEQRQGTFAQSSRSFGGQLCPPTSSLFLPYCFRWLLYFRTVSARRLLGFTALDLVDTDLTDILLLPSSLQINFGCSSLSLSTRSVARLKLCPASPTSACSKL